MGLETIANCRRQQGSALSPIPNQGQDTKQAEGLSHGSPSGFSTALVSFRSVLTAKEFPTQQFEMNGPGAEQAETEAHATKAAEKAQSKFNLNKSSSVEEYSQAAPKKPDLGRRGVALQSELPSPISTASLIPVQPAAPVRTKVEVPVSHPFVTSQFLRNHQGSNWNGAPGTKTIDSSKARAPRTQPLPDRWDSLQAAPVGPSEGGKDSLKTATDGPNESTQISLRIAYGEPGDESKESRKAATTELGLDGIDSLKRATADQGQGGRSSLRDAYAERSEERRAGPAVVLDKSSGRSEGSSSRPDSVSEFNRIPAQELTTASEVGAKIADASGEHSFRSVDRAARSSPSRGPTPSEAGCTLQSVNLGGAIPENASTQAQPNHAFEPEPRAPKMSFADPPSSNKSVPTVDHTTQVHAASEEAPHLNSSPHRSGSQQPLAPDLTRELSGVQAIKHASPIAASDASTSKQVSIKPSTQETFAALDEEYRTATPVWIHAGGNRAEAGFQDPTLGWVGVRAQVDASGEHAAVVPASAEASQALSGNLTNLGAYLADHHTPVQTLTLTSPENSSDGGNTNHSGGMEAGQGNGHGDSGKQPEASSDLTPSALGTHSNLSATRDPADSLPIQIAAGGMHISVIA